MKRLAQQIEVSTSTARKICRDDLSMFPYKIELNQPLPEDGIRRPYAIAREFEALLEDNLGIMNVAWVSNEACFHLDGYINKQNVRLLASENPRLIVANSLHSERMLVQQINFQRV
jgi:hypothetical protein